MPLKRLIVFKASLYDINKAIVANDFKKQLVEEVIPKQYHDFLPLLSTEFSDQLPQK